MFLIIDTRCLYINDWLLSEAGVALAVGAYRIVLRWMVYIVCCYGNGCLILDAGVTVAGLYRMLACQWPSGLYGILLSQWLIYMAWYVSFDARERVES